MVVFSALLFLLCSIIIIIVSFSFISDGQKSKPRIHRPPSPPALPIIGHLHLLSPAIVKSIAALSTRYGPLMRLQMVSNSSIFVSNAAIAREIMKDKEMNFAARPEIGCSGYNIYRGSTFMFADCGAYWRFMRKLCTTQLLSAAKVKEFGDVRREEMKKLLEKLVKYSDHQGGKAACDLGAELLRMVNSITCRIVMSTTGDDESMQIWKIVEDVLEIIRVYKLGELFGPLGKIGFSHYGRKMKNLLLKLDEILEKKMAEHEKNKGSEDDDDSFGKKKDVMDLLLDVSKDENAEIKLTKNHIKNFIWEILMAGGQTTADALQWTIAELINHPRVFKRLREEIETVVGSERLVEDSDIPNLHYLQAVVKESLRLHPPAAYVLRRCIKDCKIKGYDVLANEDVYLDLISIMRDPSIWENPLEFVPERFITKSQDAEQISDQVMDIRGQSFKLIPFGAGRRGCPGATLALSLSHGVIAVLVQCFDFGLEYGKALNLEDKGDIANGMVHPILCFPSMHLNPFL